MPYVPKTHTFLCVIMIKTIFSTNITHCTLPYFTFQKGQTYPNQNENPRGKGDASPWLCANFQDVCQDSKIYWSANLAPFLASDSSLNSYGCELCLGSSLTPIRSNGRISKFALYMVPPSMTKKILEFFSCILTCVKFN